MIRELIYDLRTWGISTAWYNLRFMLAFNIAKALIGEPLRLHVHTEECTEVHDETGWTKYGEPNVSSDA